MVNDEVELSTLRKEVEELRKYKRVIDRQKSTKGAMSSLLVRVWAGPDLSQSFENWLSVKRKNDDSVVTSRTADLLAAIVRRIIRVGMIAFSLAIIPSALLFWQNLIMKNQNKSLITQIEAQRKASSSQQVTDYFKLLLSDNDKERLAAISFFMSDTENRDVALERLGQLLKYGHSETACTSLTALNSLLRMETLGAKKTLYDAIVQLQPNSKLVQLHNLSCKDMSFVNVDFGPVLFFNADFPNAKYLGANVSKVMFSGNDFTRSDFRGAILCNASKNCVDFNGVNLSFSQFTINPEDRGVFNAMINLTGAKIHYSTSLLDDLKYEKEPHLVPQHTKLPSYLTDFSICLPQRLSLICQRAHYAKALGRDYSLRPECPEILNGPIIESSKSTSCETLGFLK